MRSGLLSASVNQNAGQLPKLLSAILVAGETLCQKGSYQLLFFMTQNWGFSSTPLLSVM